MQIVAFVECALLCCIFCVALVVVVNIGRGCARPYSEGLSGRAGYGFRGLGLRQRQFHDVQESR